MNIQIKSAILCYYYHVNHSIVLIESGCLIFVLYVYVRLKSDYVWYFYYALFVPNMPHLIITYISISHFIGVSLCML